MSPGFLLDTNVVSEPLRAQPDPSVLSKMRTHEKELALGAPVWHELLHGAGLLPRSRKREAIEAYLASVVMASIPILPYDRAAAEWHAGERARLQKSGRPRPYVDGQIASIAAVNDLTLVTANTKDFRFFRGLRLEDWTRGT